MPGGRPGPMNSGKLSAPSTGYDPFARKLGRADMSHPLNVLTDSKDEWDITLRRNWPTIICSPLLRISSYRLNLLTAHVTDFVNASQNAGGTEKAYHQFVQELKDDPKGQLAYQLIMSCSTDPAVADAAYTAYWKECGPARRARQPKSAVEEWTSARPVPDALRRKHASEMIPVLRYYLTHVNITGIGNIPGNTFWQPDQWPEADAAAIWAGLSRL